MTRQQLLQQIQDKQSYLCVGLDTDLSKIPAHLLETEDPIFEFNKATLTSESTHELENLIKLLRDNPKMRIELGSHTDNKGNAEYNSPTLSL
jgi:outer membrane protein OmpA-like peptidoglycan-associated protein